MLNKIFFILFTLVTGSSLFGQADSSIVVRFDFNDHEIKEAHGLFPIKPVGVTLVRDRFGNEHSAVMVQGHATSYINLGSSDLLKARRTTIAMWVNLNSIVLAGKGYPGNPFLIIKNAPGEDFTIAYGIGYSRIHKRFGSQSTRDSLLEVAAYSMDTVSMNHWYHLVMTSDDNFFSFYVNGKLQHRMKKGFETKFLAGDSVVLGRTTGTKNERYIHGIFDDVCIYHRVLNDQEVLDLYNEPNPNRFKSFLAEAMKYGIGLLALILVVIVLMLRNRQKLRQQKNIMK